MLDRSTNETSSLLARFQAERAAAYEVLRRLEPLSDGQRRLLVTNLPAARCRSVCEMLVEKSREERHQARETLRYAELAVLVSQSLTGDYADEPRARAWAELGNARRIGADLVGADEALSEAERLYGRGGADPLFQAELYSLRGSLAQYQRRFDLAIKVLGRAYRLFDRHDDLEGTARTLMTLALTHVYAGDPEPGLPYVERALALAASSSDDRLKLFAFHNLVLVLTEAGRLEEAAWHAHKVRPLIDAIGRRLDRLRFDWLTTRIGAELGVLRPAARAFDRLRGCYAEEGRPFEAALVSLDLAVIYARLNDMTRLRTLASESEAIFRALGVGRECLAALALLAHCTAAEALQQLEELRRMVEGTRSGRST
ncbi:MAG: tetratricopeptide repeat protein [Acidobacteriota bacterium]